MTTLIIASIAIVVVAIALAVALPWLLPDDEGF